MVVVDVAKPSTNVLPGLLVKIDVTDDELMESSDDGCRFTLLGSSGKYPIGNRPL